MSKIIEHICQTVALTDVEKAAIIAAFKFERLNKGDLWVKQGKICHHIGFLDTGQLRVFYNDEAGHEITCHFFMPDQFISSYTSFLTNTPSQENIAAIENSTLFSISKEGLDRLSTDIPKIHIWRRTVAENLFISMERRIALLQSKSAHERYQNMIKENPAILLSVPLQYTASFLGITPQHLSRLRKEA